MDAAEFSVLATTHRLYRRSNSLPAAPLPSHGMICKICTMIDAGYVVSDRNQGVD
jgi:predicted HNH restriction endonuclease